MTDETTNVIAFVPRRRQGAEPAEAPALMCVELRLGDDGSIEMLLRDSAGEIVAVLEYALIARSENFDLDVLRTSWELWRGGSARAS